MRKGGVKKLFLSLIVIIAIIVLFYNTWLKHQYTVPILMYHHIDDGPNASMYVKPYNFYRQMGYLRWRHYNVISLDELVEGIKAGKNFKRNTVVITFDDGYEDNYLNAYNFLKGTGFPATIFLISDYVNTQGYIKWHQAREILAESNITFGAHTKSNAYIPDIKSKDKLKEEIAGSKADIEAGTGSSVNFFCYPAGGFTPQAEQIIKESGYKGACTTNRGANKLNSEDVYALKRIKVKDSDFVDHDPISFWLKLSGYYNLFRKDKNPY